ncbi:hypothetical protein SNOG_10604 [Parastagonospora nodorum SN15]|uniref:Uncharacterized protein n=1 Tax=Phaeosphaeria nodorum (strain SN15 / ATCC MYA-4574 / FGSC 10173) TaxID=321614 RepID=Q0UCB0_PHANO|nr:hypothetical protein SNOG_10604 [Parastagonospora nodorum SN15]EAT81998.1 hypothetical protein SNOG_10604 [Parastagonospora nodorum SN15]
MALLNKESDLSVPLDQAATWPMAYPGTPYNGNHPTGSPLPPVDAITNNRPQ